MTLADKVVSAIAGEYVLTSSDLKEVLEIISPSVSDTYVNLVIDLWRQFPVLHQNKKMTRDISGVIKQAIQTYGIDNCFDAISNYNTMLSSDYYMNYKWDIKTFFKQKNAAPHLFNDGIKWINYLEHIKKQSNKNIPWSSVDALTREDIKNDVNKALELYFNNNTHLLLINSINGATEEEKLIKKRSISIGIRPILFCYICKHRHIYVDEDIDNDGESFIGKFERVLFKSRGAVYNQVDFEKQYKALWQ